MKKGTIVTVALVAGGLVWWLIAYRVGAPKPSIKALEAAIAATGPGADHPNDLKAAHVAAPVPAPYIDGDEFKHRFSVGEIECMDITSSINEVARDLAEKRGLQARVTFCDGHTLKFVIPGLVVDEDELKASLRAALVKVVGEAKAAEIWADGQGRRYILVRRWVADLGAEDSYAITKVREEALPEGGGDLEDAKFDVERLQSATRAGVFPAATPAQRWIYEGYEFSRAEGLGLSWNAMAKAPAGYFRAEMILGVASRPTDPGLVVHEDYDKGTAEIRNLSAPGSRETIDLKSFPAAQKWAGK